MAAGTRQLDVWIQETNTVYRGVPFPVVTDWVQEGRLLANDKVRVSGTEKWAELGKVPALAAFLPRPDPQRAEDVAEALEPVETEVRWPRAKEVEDEDVDLVPMIDISFTLLVFFVVTAAVATGVFSPINTPRARYDLLALAQDMFWIGIDVKGPDGRVDKDADGDPLPWYSFGKGNAALKLGDGADAPTATRDIELVKARLEAELTRKTDQGKLPAGEVQVRLRADQTLPVEVIRATTTELQKLEARINAGREEAGKLDIAVSGEVSAPKE